MCVWFELPEAVVLLPALCQPYWGQWTECHVKDRVYISWFVNKKYQTEVHISYLNFRYMHQILIFRSRRRRHCVLLLCVVCVCVCGGGGAVLVCLY